MTIISDLQKFKEKLLQPKAVNSAKPVIKKKFSDCFCGILHFLESLSMKNREEKN